MTIKELKEIIADLPDDTGILVETSHTLYDWQDECSSIVDAEYFPETEILTISATIKDEL